MQDERAGDDDELDELDELDEQEEEEGDEEEGDEEEDADEDIDSDTGYYEGWSNEMPSRYKKPAASFNFCPEHGAYVGSKCPGCP